MLLPENNVEPVEPLAGAVPSGGYVMPPALSLNAPPSDVLRPPTYVINLDLPPSERWNEIVRDYAQNFRDVERQIDGLMKGALGSVMSSVVDALLGGILGGASRGGFVMYHKEMQAIAKQSGLPLGKLVLLQLTYEASACCSSIVVPSADGVPLHIRTMDWGMDFLGPLTIEVDMQRGGKTLYKTTTWAGYVGVLTGMRPGAYAVSVNFRVTGDGFWANLKKAINRCWPIGFLLRDVFETTGSYDQAVSWLAQSELIAPCYFTISGTHVNQAIGALVTRARASEEKRWTVSESGPVVQTNIDHWSSNENDDIMDSIERRALARTLLEQMQYVASAETLWDLVSQPPILNSITVYGTFMCATLGVFQTRMPQRHLGFRSAARDGAPVRLPDTAAALDALLDPENRPDPLSGVFVKGTWHATYADCSYLKCGWHLGVKGNIGSQHWSCCYETKKTSRCKNRKHTLLPSDNK